MKKNNLQTLFLSNLPLLIISLCLGYSFWYIATYDQTIILQLSVPLCFTDKIENYSLQAPETLQVTLKGKRSDIYALERKSLAAHVNINTFLPGKHGIVITEQNLFLPKNITLVHYTPANLTITVSEIINS